MPIIETKNVVGGPFESSSVVETVNGFPRGDKAVDAAFIASMVSCFISDGIFPNPADSFKVSPGDGLTVSVSPGYAWAKGYMARLDEALSFDVTPGYQYTVFLRQNISSGESSVMLFQGTAAGLPVRSKYVHDLILAEVTVTSAADAVTSGMILDKRSDSEVCGYITSKLI